MSQKESNTHQGEQQPLDVADEATAKQLTRRRLLKAAGMAPVIYTLPAGAQAAAGSISCAGEPGNVLTDDVTRDGINILVNDEKFCKLERGNSGSGSTCTTPSGDEYIYEIDAQGNETITAGSCWNSLNPTG